MASIREHKKANGEKSYYVLWRDSDTGKQSSMKRSVRSEAEELVRVIEANGNSLNAVERFYEKRMADGPTVAALIDKHIRTVTGAGPYMVKRYGDYLRLHIKTHELGGFKAKAVSRDDVRAWVKWMEGRGKAPKTISNVFGLISSAFINAGHDGVVDRNPCAGVKLPKVVKGGAEDEGEMSREDFDAIRAEIHPHFRPFLDFLLGAGTRFSEATALTAADFKLDAATPTVRITKAWKESDDGSWYIGAPKTDKGYRTISLAPSTVASIRPLVEAAGKGRVFRMKRGGVMTPQAFYNRAWSLPRKAVGLENKVTVHSIRHLHAALMLSGGMDMYELSRRMGHEDIQITVNRYSHLLPDAHFRTAQAAQRALEGDPLATEAKELPPTVIEEAEIIDGGEDEVA
jgi:integrase